MNDVLVPVQQLITKLQTENLKLRKSLSELIEESDDYRIQNKCGCQHPSCRSCANDKDLTEKIVQAHVSLSE